MFYEDYEEGVKDVVCRVFHLDLDRKFAIYDTTMESDMEEYAQALTREDMLDMFIKLSEFATSGFNCQVKNMTGTEYWCKYEGVIYIVVDLTELGF